MNTEYLIKMANQIGTFYQTQPDRGQAETDLAKHFQNTWEQRMRKALLDHIDATGGETLLPIVRDAVARHRRDWPGA